MLVGQLALVTAAMFAGAALYINVVEQPARLGLDHRSLLTEWKPAYKRGAVMQASLAILSFMAGAAAWWLGGGFLWLVGAVLIGLVVPFTLVVVKPTNKQLLDPARDPASAETRRLLEQWGKLHAVRSGLSLAATLLYMDLLIRA